MIILHDLVSPSRKKEKINSYLAFPSMGEQSVSARYVNEKVTLTHSPEERLVDHRERASARWRGISSRPASTACSRERGLRREGPCPHLSVQNYFFTDATRKVLNIKNRA